MVSPVVGIGIAGPYIVFKGAIRSNKFFYGTAARVVVIAYLDNIIFTVESLREVIDGYRQVGVGKMSKVLVVSSPNVKKVVGHVFIIEIEVERISAIAIARSRINDDIGNAAFLQAGDRANGSPVAASLVGEPARRQ